MDLKQYSESTTIRVGATLLLVTGLKALHVEKYLLDAGLGDVTQVANTIYEILIGVIVAFGLWLKARRIKAAGAAAGGAEAKNGDVSKTFNALYVLVALVPLAIAAAALTACAQQPMRQWAQLQQSQDATLKSITAFHGLGVISDEELVATEPVTTAVQGAIDQVKVAAKSGNATAMTTAMTVFDAVNQKLMAWYIAKVTQIGGSHGNGGTNSGGNSGGTGGAATRPAAPDAGAGG